MLLRSFTVLALLAAVNFAHAQDRPIGFQTPSKNIGCQFYTDNGQGMLRCNITNMDARPRRPADCELDYGHAFEMSAKGAAGRICAGDTVMDPSLPVLAYGEVWQRAGFTCRSEQTGLTCFNAMQHGFSLARAEQKVF
ncbi:hypothetical protein KUL72_04885 [Bradyrhizobium arachidis]|uniref:DUF6636 domain-containing protein n=1 Tax=Bradyrhizobium TaxID=374 RepID=UPI00216326D1|nr:MULTISPECIES: DUF6636 domain-containing protein [Bradyrhizobium]MDN4986882.1 hypothetical protein [Bradyrhizobium sp. WYCCWR 13022]UVO37729.1 hypothetical protein KUL72_04885 [Bradyrhizobium arachidis]